MNSCAAVLRACCICIALSCNLSIAAAQALSTSEASRKDAVKKDELTPLQKDKLEIEKLKAEVDGLIISNKALSAEEKRWSTWAGTLGGLFGGLLALVAFVFGRGFNRTQEKKLEQERVLSREKHNMELFEALGDSSVRIQLAAASVLMQRLKSFPSKLSPDEELEKNTIVQVLIAVTKKSDGNTSANAEAKRSPYGIPPAVQHSEADAAMHPALGKVIADGLVKALCADPTSRNNQAPDRESASPLQPYDFQKVQFRNAHWQGVDARKVEFFRADLSDAGFKNAFFEGAVLNEANLQDSWLLGADLRNADLRKADLRNAKLRGAKLQGAMFDGAKVAGAVLTGATYGDNPAGEVVVSGEGSPECRMSIDEWLKREAAGEVFPKEDMQPNHA